MKYLTIHSTRICLLNNGLNTRDQGLDDNTLECKFSVSNIQSLFGTLSPLLWTLDWQVQHPFPSMREASRLFTREMLLPFLTIVDTTENLAITLLSTLSPSTQR